MKIQQVTVRKNVANPDNRFEHTHAEAVVELEARDNAVDAFRLAEAAVDRQLGIDYTTEEVERAEKLVRRARARKAG